MSTVAPRCVGILGGMGPGAGAEFVRVFIEECTAQLQARQLEVNDQAYPAHWLAQLPVVDRSTALADADAPQPLAGMVDGLRQLAGTGAQCVAMACNTAHAWHAELQGAVPGVRLLNVLDEVALELGHMAVDRAGLLATQGTYASGLYARALARRGIACMVPPESERQKVMDAIYHGVKRGHHAQAAKAFAEVALSVAQRHGVTTIILGCTEIPLVLRDVPPGLRFVDPARVLARALAAHAYGNLQHGPGSPGLKATALP